RLGVGRREGPESEHILSEPHVDPINLLAAAATTQDQTMADLVLGERGATIAERRPNAEATEQSGYSTIVDVSQEPKLNSPDTVDEEERLWRNRLAVARSGPVVGLDRGVHHGRRLVESNIEAHAVLRHPGVGPQPKHRGQA